MFEQKLKRDEPISSRFNEADVLETELFEQPYGGIFAG